MARVVPYDRQTVASRNPATRLAHRSRLRRSAALVDEYLPPNGTVLDFGANRGQFLNDLRTIRPDARLIGYDRYVEPIYDGLEYARSTEELADSSVDVVTALEVLEHLQVDVQSAFASEARRMLKPTGRVIVSVPIIFGPVALVKEASKMITHRRGLQYSIPELARILFGLPIERPADVRHSHKGFDFRQLRTRLEAEFVIEQTLVSPFAGLHWLFNSQVFFIGRART